MDLKELDLHLTPAFFFDTIFFLHFLDGKKDLFKKKYALQLDKKFSFEKQSVKLFAAWTKKAIYFGFEFKEPFSIKDKIDLFIDSKNQKPNTKTKVCHQFTTSFTEDGLKIEETTQFRNPEDTHELADPKLLSVKRDDAFLTLIIDHQALYKMDLKKDNLIGFHYSLKDKNEEQSFYFPKEMNVESIPKLWQTLKLKD